MVLINSLMYKFGRKLFFNFIIILVACRSLPEGLTFNVNKLLTTLDKSFYSEILFITMSKKYFVLF